MDRRALLLALVLGSQALLPLHYYLRPDDGAEALDERFAWRMFSPQRMVSCEYAYVVEGEVQPLGGQFHSAWITLVKRGRWDVTQAVGRRLCLTNPGREVLLHYRCRGVDGSWELLADGEDMCP